MIKTPTEFHKNCEICNKECKNLASLTRHLKSHDTNIKDYIVKYVFDGKNPTCKCGCGAEMKFKQDSKYLPNFLFRSYAKGHAPSYERTDEMISQMLSTRTERQSLLPEEELLEKKLLANEKRSIAMKARPDYVPKTIKPTFTSDKYLKDDFKCELCEQEFNNSGKFVAHLRKEHQITKKDYFTNIVCKNNPVLCSCGCGEPTNFSDDRNLKDNNYFEYYLPFHRERQPDSPETIEKKVTNMRNTMLEKYGTTNPMEIDGVKEKMYQTKFERYGDSKYTNIEKQLSTRKERYNIKTHQEKLDESEERRRLSKINKSIKRHNEKLEKEQKLYQRLERIENNKLLKELNKQEPKKIVDNTSHVCKICGENNTIHGMRTHIRHKHTGINVDDYVREYGEFRPSIIDLKNRLLESNVTCEICGEKMTSERMLTMHLQSTHNISKRDYIIEYIFDGIEPTCQCSPECQEKVVILEHGKNDKGELAYARKFIKGHEVYTHVRLPITEETRAKMSKSAIARKENQVMKDTKGELAFKDFLNNLNVPFVHQYPREFGLIDFYLPEHELLVEIDGSYYHPVEKYKLTRKQLTGAIGDRRKHGKVDYRILDTDVPKLESIEDLDHFNRYIEMTISHDQVIMSKDYFGFHLFNESTGKDFIRTMVPNIKRLLKIYEPDFPYPEPKESLAEITSKIREYDISSIYNDNNKVFENNIYAIGNSYLKSIFKSYYHTRYKSHEMTPYQMYQNDDSLSKIISYRVGLNDFGEYYDLSYKEILKGISAIRGTVSFFKPLLASTIYRTFLKSKETPIVLDPCCGFGGRLLGFKSSYPNGKYVGCEPNIDTYNELLELAKNFTNVEIHNCKFEDFVSDKNIYDLVFTSIPYYDLEIYSNQQEYKNIQEWKDTFIKSLLEYDNLLLNVPMNLEYLFKESSYQTYFLGNNVARHIDKSKTKKYELILKFD